jgi:hypothetical protein
MKDPLTITDAEMNAELAIMQKFARAVLFTALGLCGLFVVSGAVATMLLH